MGDAQKSTSRAGKEGLKGCSPRLQIVTMSTGVKSSSTHLEILRAGYTAGIFEPTGQVHTLGLRWACVVGQSTGIYVHFTVFSQKS